jgi:hypothetical protein
MIEVACNPRALLSLKRRAEAAALLTWALVGVHLVVAATPIAPAAATARRRLKATSP